MTRPADLAVAGAGRWGRNWIRAVQASPAARLAAVASRNPETPAFAGGDCEIFTDLKTLLDKRRVDGVIIATPPQTHAPLARAAVDRGVPVLIEKPLCLDADEAESLAAHAEDKGVFADVSYVLQYTRAWEILRSGVKAPAVRAIRSAGGNWGPFRKDTPPLWDYACHDAAMCCALMGGPPASVSARAVDVQTIEGVRAGTYDLQLTFAGGVTAVIQSGNTMTEKVRRFEADTEDSTWVFDDLAPEPLVRIDRDSGTRHNLGAAGEPPLGRAVAAFAARIAAGGKTKVSPLRFSVTVTRVLTALEDSLSK